MAWRSAATAERDLDALVALAFAADLEHADALDLHDIGDMRATAGLQIDAGDAEQPHASGAARRLHAHGLDELRLRVELGIRDPHRLGGSAGDDERVGLALNPLGVELTEIDVERYRLTGLQHGTSGRRHVQHPVRRLPLAGVDDRDCFALRTHELAAVA